MSLFFTASAVLPLILRVDALTDDEIAKFVSSGCGVRYGSCAGEFMYGEVSVTKNTADDTISFAANGIPDHETCADTYSAGETCYTDPLTSWFEEQDINVVMPLNPELADSATGLPGGAAGYAINGVQIFSAYSLECTDAVIDEAIGFDGCLGHPQEQGNYHYHATPICLDGYAEATANQERFLVGVALDGFPIYLEFGEDGEMIGNSVLDDCHGYDPEDGNGYRYIVNDEFPYILGCYSGTPLTSTMEMCGRRRLSAQEIEIMDAEIQSVLSASRRRLLQPGGGGGGGSSSTQEADGCGEACSGDCGEMDSVAMCGATPSGTTPSPTAPTAPPTAPTRPSGATPTNRPVAEEEEDSLDSPVGEEEEDMACPLVTRGFGNREDFFNGKWNYLGEHHGKPYYQHDILTFLLVAYNDDCGEWMIVQDQRIDMSCDQAYCLCGAKELSECTWSCGPSDSPSATTEIDCGSSGSSQNSAFPPPPSDRATSELIVITTDQALALAVALLICVNVCVAMELMRRRCGANAWCRKTSYAKVQMVEEDSEEAMQSEAEKILQVSN